MQEDRGGFVLSIVQESRQLAVYIYSAGGALAASVSRVWEGPLSADELLSSAITLSDVAVRRAGVTPFELVGVSVAASPHAVVCWEAVSGRPLGLWQTPVDWTARGSASRTTFLRSLTPGLAVDSERGAHGLRVGGVESWLVWNLTQGEAFALDVSHDLADLAPRRPDAGLQDAGLPDTLWPSVARGPGVLGRVAAVYLGGARPPVTSVACAPAAALYATGVQDAGAVFIGYREDGYTVARLEQRHLSLLAPGVRATVKPLGLPHSGDPAYACFGRFFAPQLALLWLETMFAKPDQSELAESLFAGDAFVVHAPGDRADRVTLAGVDVNSGSVDLFAAALRSMALCVDSSLACVPSGSVLRLQLFADDFSFAEPSLFAFQASLEQCAVTVSAGDASGFGAGLLALVGADELSPVKARELAQFGVHRERYDPARAVPGLDRLRERWRKWENDLL